VPRNNPLRAHKQPAQPPKKRRGPRVPQLRLLPVTIVVAAAMLMVRVNDIWTVVDPSGLPHISLNQSEAQQPPPPGGKKKKGDPQPVQPVAPTPAPAAKAAPAQDGSGQAASANGASGDAPAAVQGGQPAEGEPPIFTQNEVDVLEKLSARRQALDAREKDIAGHENLLKAAEDRIDKKIAEMKALQSDVKVMLQKIDAEDDAKLKSLVKVYETMKPKDAARIFEQLDMPVLLGVVSNMKEAKIAAVMEAMDAAKAKTLTDALVARRATKIEGQAAAAGAAPTPGANQTAAAGDQGTPTTPAQPAAAGANNPPAAAPKAPGG
jgi:flagellar motility protein MotE (MotC chaperone)